MKRAARRLLEKARALMAVGSLESAGRILDQILKTEPRNAETLHMLGVVSHQLARHHRAAALIEQAILVDSDNAAYHNNLGNVLQALDRPDAAMTAYQRALTIAPASPQIHDNLGAALQSLGEHEAAVKCYRTSIELSPTFAEAHCHLAAALEMQAPTDAALVHLRRAIALNPAYADAHLTLGRALERRGHALSALMSYQEAVRLDPQCIEALCRLGLAYQTMSRFLDAQRCYERALDIDPENTIARNNLGYTLFSQGFHEAALGHYRQALSIDSAYVDAANNLGFALHAAGRFAEARECYENALSIDWHYAELHNNLGNLLKDIGELDAARKCYDRAIAINPQLLSAHYNRAEMISFTANEDALKKLEALDAVRDSLPADSRHHLHFALAKALEDMGESEQSFQQLHLGNALIRQQISYDEPGALAYLERLSCSFRPERMQGLRCGGKLGAGVIFIVGMPRSGTTLVEQILCSHARVHGGGELVAFDRAIDRMLGAARLTGSYPECVDQFSAEHLAAVGLAYLDQLPGLPEGRTVITDKLPGNFANIGMIHLALPGARIVHVRRDARDTCLSCFSKPFASGHEYTYELAELARYHRAYAALMDHWHAALPTGAIFDIDYEELVSDFQPQLRALLAYCGLAWDDRCLKFHETARVITTASALQVRRPLNQNSMGRWRRLEKQLEPLTAILEAEESFLRETAACKGRE